MSLGRFKIKCKGTNLDGSPCNNWAIKDSMYCQRHQYQMTQSDQDEWNNAGCTSTIIFLVILVIAFIISLIFGCEDEFINSFN